MLKLNGALSRRDLGLGAAALALSACTGTQTHADEVKTASAKDIAMSDTDWANLTAAEWKGRLTDMEFYVLREEGTERPGSSPLDREKREGTFVCGGCALPLFKSEMKYNSGTGWPSFFDVIPNAVGTKVDHKLFMAPVSYTHLTLPTILLV